jgi:hypothetical protein
VHATLGWASVLSIGSLTVGYVERSGIEFGPAHWFAGTAALITLLCET